jgi:hypothetical protein
MFGRRIFPTAFICSIEVTMLVYWSFRCDQNHVWEATAEDSQDPGPDLVRCPVDGTDAVTAVRQEPADRVRVGLVPAARVVDAVKGSIGHDSDYYLEISSFDGAMRLRSARPYSWEQAIKKASMFRHASWADASRRWKRSGLDTPSEQ